MAIEHHSIEHIERYILVRARTRLGFASHDTPRVYLAHASASDLQLPRTRLAHASDLPRTRLGFTWRSCIIVGQRVVVREGVTRASSAGGISTVRADRVLASTQRPVLRSYIREIETLTTRRVE